MRFLIDEMFSPALAQALRTLGHDALHVSDVGLAATEDDEILADAARHSQILITENAADFIPLLDEATAADQDLTPVVIVLKSTLPRPAGALAHHLAQRLSAWAGAHPQPYPHVHWLD